MKVVVFLFAEKELRVEVLMKVATYTIVPVELVSIIWRLQNWGNPIACWVGIAIAAVGVLVFILAMATMKDSWRAGIPNEDKTELVTTGRKVLCFIKTGVI